MAYSICIVIYMDGYIHASDIYMYAYIHNSMKQIYCYIYLAINCMPIEYEGDDSWSQLQLQTVCVLKLHYCEKATVDDIGLQKYEQNWSLQMHNNSMHLAWQKDPIAK